VDLVQKGDVLKVLPGARIPTDGFILAGTAFIDESMITGESVPTLHGPGDAVFGSTVNQQSIIYVKATAIGSEVSMIQSHALSRVLSSRSCVFFISFLKPAVALTCVCRYIRR
jgi:P-type E1-E2 ATPase